MLLINVDIKRWKEFERAYKETITPYHVKHELINTWNVTPSFIDKWFDKYYILHWQGVYLAERVENGVILHDGVRYRINWITVPTLCYKSDQVQLSFRRIFGQAEGYVLIKVKGKV